MIAPMIPQIGYARAMIDSITFWGGKRSKMRLKVGGGFRTRENSMKDAAHMKMDAISIPPAVPASSALKPTALPGGRHAGTSRVSHPCRCLSRSSSAVPVSFRSTGVKMEGPLPARCISLAPRDRIVSQ